MKKIEKIVILIFVLLSMPNLSLAEVNKQKNKNIKAESILNTCPAGQVLHQKLKVGDKNGKFSAYQKEKITEVKILQTHLNRLGYGSGSVDGIIGPVTKKAIQRMQNFLKVVPDGIVGPFTITAINNSCGEESQKEEVKKTEEIKENKNEEELKKQRQKKIIEELKKKLEELLEKKKDLDKKEELKNSKKEKKYSDKAYITYKVSKNAEIIPDEKENVRKVDKEIWEIFLGTVGREYAEKNINNFILFENPENDFSAFVVKVNNWEKWNITVNIAEINMENGIEEDLLKTLIHEFNHIFSQNLEQIDPDIKEKKCEVTYWTGEGCAHGDSYINEFVREFWDYADLEEVFTEEEIVGGEEKMKNIFKENSKKYNTAYSVVNPVEDMAESFTFFILNNKKFNTETEANEKINFFYDYTELIETRKRIRTYLNTLYIVK